MIVSFKSHFCTDSFNSKTFFTEGFELILSDTKILLPVRYIS